MDASKPLKIWTVVVGEPSPVDGAGVRRLRTGLLSRYLRARGHDVTWFNGTVEHSGKTQRFDKTTITSDADGTTLAFLHGRLYHANISVARIRNHRETAKSFAELAPQLPAPDVITCSYPTLELCAAVADYATRRGIPYVLDLRDLWPDMIAEVAPAPLRPLARLAMAPWFLSARSSMRRATGLVAFSRPYLDWGLQKIGRAMGANDRVFHLASDPEPAAPEALQSAAAMWDGLGVTQGTINLVFSGMLSTRHDFDTIIDGALSLPPEMQARIRIVFCGKGEAQEAMKARAAGAAHIVFAGWRNLAEIQALFARSHAGLLPYRGTQDFLMAFPNKVGEYTGAGLPIVTSLDGEVGKLIAAENCGLKYREGDWASFAALLEGIASGRTDLAPLSANARRVYERRFYSPRIYGDYADFLEGLARSAGANKKAA